MEETQRLDRINPRFKPEPPEPVQKKGVPNFVWVILSCVLALIVFTVVGIIWISNTDDAGAAALASESSQVDSAVTSEADSLLAASAESSDPNMIDAPNLVGQNYEDLKAAVSSDSTANQDYQVLLSTKQFSDTIPEGGIISQSPAAGTKMAKGAEIVVVVSQGAAVRTLPDITGKSLADASEAVTSAGFVPTKDEEYSSTVAAGSAIGYKEVKAGSQMPYGSSVMIVISKGPDPSLSSEDVSSGTTPSGSAQQ